MHACRMLFAYSRDKALPLSSVWAHVHPTLKIPVNGIWCTVGMAMLFGLPMIYGPQAFAAITSVCTVALYLAYTLPLFFR